MKLNYDIIGICIAYEQGYGHGYDQRNMPNPYTEKSETWMAYDYGYSEGNRKKISDDLKTPNAVLSGKAQNTKFNRS